QQNALRDACAESAILLFILQERDDFLQLGLRLVDASHIVKSDTGISLYENARLGLANVNQAAQTLPFRDMAESEHPDAEENEHRDEPGQKGGQKRIVDGPRNRNAPAGKLLGELRIDAIGDEELSAVDWLL